MNIHQLCLECTCFYDGGASNCQVCCIILAEDESSMTDIIVRSNIRFLSYPKNGRITRSIIHVGGRVINDVSFCKYLVQ